MSFPAEHKKLRFAIMLQGEFIKKWQYDVIVKLIESNLAVPVLLIFNGNTDQARNLKQRMLSKLFWKIYEKVYLRKGPLKNVPFPEILKSVDSISCKTEKKGKFSEYFIDNDIIRIQSFQPDLILRFGFSIIRGKILHAAPFGIWSFHHSDEQTIRGGPAGFWEVYLRHRLHGAILQRLTESLDGGIILKKRFYKTVLHDCSFNLFHVLDSSADMPLQVCKDILNGEAFYFNNPPAETKATVYTFPENSKMLLFAIKQIISRIRFNLNDLFRYEKWAVGLIRTDQEIFIENISLHENAAIFKFKSADTYPADPFALQTDKGLRIFFEKYDYKKQNACISSVMYEETKGFFNEKPVISDNSHRSFPFIFENGGKIYLIPEQIETGRTDLYEWDETQESLQYINTLLNEPLADPVLYYYNNVWWLFGSKPGKNINNTLDLYFSHTFSGEFKPHPQNSIVCNPTGARMAGNLVSKNGKLFRPGQDSHIYYGQRICMFEIIQMTETSYTERFSRYIRPHKNSNLRKGIHTLNICPPYIIFDGKQNVFSVHGFLHRFKRKITGK